MRMRIYAQSKACRTYSVLFTCWPFKKKVKEIQVETALLMRRNISICGYTHRNNHVEYSPCRSATKKSRYPSQLPHYIYSSIL